MLREPVDISVFVDALGVALPPQEEFFKLGDLTALKTKKDGSFFARILSAAYLRTHASLIFDPQL